MCAHVRILKSTIAFVTWKDRWLNQEAVFNMGGSFGKCLGVFIEGEFHAVWRKADGSLLDVSFKSDGETKASIFHVHPEKLHSTNSRLTFSDDGAVLIHG